LIYSGNSLFLYFHTFAVKGFTGQAQEKKKLQNNSGKFNFQKCDRNFEGFNDQKLERKTNRADN